MSRTAPDERVGALLDEEAHRVALAQRRRRRGRAEDHHQPERDKAKRDEDEHPLLELALHQTSSSTSRRNASPRASKSSNWSKLAHAGESRTTSPGTAASAASRTRPQLAAVQVGNVRRVERGGDLPGGVTDQVGAVAELEVCCQRPVALLLARARRGSRAGVVAERVERAPCRGDVRRLRVVDPAHAAHDGHVLDTMLNALERRSASAIASSSMPAARAAAVAAAAFSRLCRPRNRRLGRQRVVARELDAARGTRNRAEAAREPRRRPRRWLRKTRSFASAYASYACGGRRGRARG